MDYLLSPAQTVIGSLGLSPSPKTTVSLTSTPTLSTHPPGSTFSSVSTAVSVGKQPASRPNTRSSLAKAPRPSSSKPTSSATAGRRRAKNNADSSSSSAAPAPASDPAHHHPAFFGRKPGGAGGRRLSVPESKARNRLAATKCRLKTKAMTERLEALEAAESEQNRSLAATAAALRDQVYELSNMLLQHVGCGCEMIQAYLVRRARALAEAASREGEEEEEDAAGADDGGRQAMEDGKRCRARWRGGTKGRRAILARRKGIIMRSDAMTEAAGGGGDGYA